MPIEEIKKKLSQDHYIDIAFERYQAFKENDVYDENNKFEILPKLNEYFQHVEIAEHSVVEIAKTLQKENPNVGSFVHWGSMDDFVKYAEGKPEEVAKLWNQLLHSELELTEKIEQFRKHGKSFKPDISLGASLFGYLLAAYDYNKYPLYKEEVFQAVKKLFGIDRKLGSVSENYTFFFNICREALQYFKRKNPSLTMLDIQDFFYCITSYDKVIVETAVHYLYEIAVKSHLFMENPENLLNYLVTMDITDLQEQREIYRNEEKVKKIRFLVLDKIIQDRTISMNDFEKIKQEVSAQYETNILQSWTDFSILYQLYYNPIKNKVREEQRKIHEAIQRMDELKDIKFVQGKALNGFTWNQHYGGSECWLALYEEKYSSHKAAPQLYLTIDHNGIKYGLGYGSELPQSREQWDTDHITDIYDFTYEKLHQKLVSVLDEFLGESVEVEDFSNQKMYYTDDLLTKEEWLDLMKNPQIFKESDLQYMFTMYELGGKATQVELAEKFDKHPSSFISPIVALAKRVLAVTGLEPFKDDEGKDRYWPTFFNGYYTDKKHFMWELKPNFKQAIEQLYDEKHQQLPKYSKESFLEEVFIDETLYETIVSLLHYKKNIILQGPPGVGKTFVAKRLAYSLIGAEDPNRVEIIQFHQNYAYEDFIMGYRPDTEGKFSLQTGIFYDFCKKAQDNPEESYYFIIDEINRGNLSKIFGELFMLIEHDKREDLITLSYSKEKFTVPSNVYIIGTMNTADRSLAQMEVALRRRFAFITLQPTFNEKWESFMLNKGVTTNLLQQIISFVSKLNEEIRQDFQLGNGYEIGHSFFTNFPEGTNEELWFENILQYEIKPLLEEYFYDRPEKVSELLEGR